jgi:AcrR family transcriptional regulator
MGRNAIVTRGKIIEAARTLLSKYGFFKMTIEDIAKALHVGKSALYYYFADKEAIMTAVLDEDIGTIKKRVTGAVESAGSPREKLRRYAVIRMTFFKEFATINSALKDDYLQHFASIQRIRKKYDEFEISLIHAILTEGVKKRLFSVRDLDLTSATVFAAIKGIEYDWASRFDTATIEKNINAMVDVLLFGIMQRKGVER